jgi:hypothetical protein
MGVSFMKVGDDEEVVAVARSSAAALAKLESLKIAEPVVAAKTTSGETTQDDPAE